MILQGPGLTDDLANTTTVKHGGDVGGNPKTLCVFVTALTFTFVAWPTS